MNGRSSSFAYNADGIRTAKAVGRRLVGYLLDGGNVIGETEGGELVATYQRGVNLISCIDPRDTNFEETYYIYNAHGDVVQLVDESGNLTKSYEYDAFGNEKNKTSDPNPFRYCGEYYDAESGSYYLRARYYNPSVGRFTQKDTHWNTGNMIYGDAPQQIGEYKDPLGVSRCTYAPQTAAIMQAGNLYAYGINNPVMHIDPSGEIAITTLILIGSAVVGLIAAADTAYKSYKYTGKIDWVNTIATGLTWFALAYSVGMNAYAVYLSYCAYKGIVPVTEVNFRASNNVPTDTGRGASADSRLLRSNLIASGESQPTHKNAAHHIVAGSAPKAEEARMILNKYGIDINSAENGVFLPTERGVSNSAYHPSLHTNSYYEKVNSLLREATSKNEVLEILNYIKHALQSGTF